MKELNKERDMGLFSNPLSYAGYPPGVTGTPTTQNASIRAATATEAAAGTLTNCYISPATADSATALDFASPPVLGFGSTTKRPVHATTLESTLNTDLVNTAAATSFAVANIAPSGARTSTYNGGNSAQNDTVTWFGGNPSANTQSFTMFGGAPSGGTQTVGFFTGNASGGTQSFSVLTGTRAGTFNVGTGAAAHVLNLGNSAALIGFFGATAVAKPANTDDLRTALINLGLYTTGGATPLNLNGGALTTGSITANGNIVKNVAGNKDVYTSVASTTTAGANSAGTVTLVGGTATISTTAVTASSIIRLTRQSVGATGANPLGMLSVGTIVASTSFVINALSATDATTLAATDVSVIGWEIIN